jgi:hypothetical protein
MNDKLKKENSYITNKAKVTAPTNWLKNLYGDVGAGNIYKLKGLSPVHNF